MDGGRWTDGDRQCIYGPGSSSGLDEDEATRIWDDGKKKLRNYKNSDTTNNTPANSILSGQNGTALSSSRESQRQ